MSRRYVRPGQLAGACVLSAGISFTLVAVGVTAPPSASGAEAARTCRGVAATLVGTPDTRRLRGTTGDDVIVTGGALMVDARAGNDLICVTSLTEWVTAGDGDDVVATDGRAVDTFTELGSGTDTFIGGARRDNVSSGAGSDRVETGGGADVYSGGSFPASDDQAVNLGPGNDRAEVAEGISAGVLDGGPGLNTLSMGVCCDEDRSWVVNNVTGIAAVDREERFHWNNFRGFSFDAFDVAGTVVFEGSDASEVVTAKQEFEFGPDIERLDMAGGDDQVVLIGLLGPAIGGEGNDWVRAVGFADERSLSPAVRVGVDLVRDRLRVDDGSPETVRITEVENVEVSDFITAVLHGDRRPNSLLVGQACLTRLYGHGGDDVLRGRRTADRCPAWITSFPGIIRGYGGTGDDLLSGRWTPDRFFGGPGRDSADGRGGADACKVEIRLRCER